MRTWVEAAARQGAEFVLFPELNVTGYIQHAIVRQFAEPIPGPSTAKAIQLARDMGVTLAYGLQQRRGSRPR
jgi:predicted amidohydrolase